MFRILAITLLALAAAPAWAKDVSPKPLNMAQKFEGLSRGPDGWVAVEFTVNEKGRVVAAHVTQSYPRGLLDAAVLKGVTRARFRPATHDGQPITATTRMSLRVVRSQTYTVRPSNMAIFRTVLEAIREGKTPEAALAPIVAQYKGGTLNLVEVPRMFYLQAPIHRLTQRFNQGRLEAEFALSFGSMLGDEKVLDAMRMEEILATIGLGDPGRAIELYDEWVARKRPFPQELKDLIERSRTDQSKVTASAVVNYPVDPAVDVSEPTVAGK